MASKVKWKTIKGPGITVRVRRDGARVEMQVVRQRRRNLVVCKSRMLAEWGRWKLWTADFPELPKSEKVLFARGCQTNQNHATAVRVCKNSQKAASVVRAIRELVKRTKGGADAKR